MKIKDQYSNLAKDYHWLLSDVTRTGEPFYKWIADVLKGLSGNARILDCACGPGEQLTEMVRRGWDVSASDASPGMIAEARGLAKRKRLRIPFRVAEWKELPRVFKRPFDLVLCFGNAIGHSKDYREMVASLRGMYGVTKPGGTVMVHSRNWEAHLKSRRRFETYGYRIRGKERGIAMLVNTYRNSLRGPHLIEVVCIVEKAGNVSIRAYPVTYYGFRHKQLLRAMKEAGFSQIRSDFSPKVGRYVVTGCRL